MNLQRDRWTGHAAQMEKFETRSKFWSANLREDKISIEWTLKK
jgi:hypothetical protein